jgi:hypothetical protein
MLKSLSEILIDLGFKETRKSAIGEFVVERAFVE